MERTICAIATAQTGTGGISIIRISGTNSISVCDKLFFANNSAVNTPSEKTSDSIDKSIDDSNKTQRIFAKNFEPRKFYLGEIKTPFFKDKCMAVLFKAPYSYTGEDVIEFHLHGGKALTNGVLKACLDNGCVLAEPGEFTKLAFLNGKLSLSQCEGVIDMINAESEAEVKAGFDLLSGKLSQTATHIQERLMQLLSEFFVYINHLDEDIDRNKTLNELMEIKKSLNDLLSTYSLGQMIKDGVNVCIVGKPNVGKSSVLNELTGFDRAIVTDVAGTTRDTLDVSFSINGIKLNLVDTAGIRNSNDTVEKIGIERSKKAIENSDIAIFVVDASQDLTDEDKEILMFLKDKCVIEILNKKDKAIVLEPHFEKHIFVSAKTGEGIEILKQMLYKIIVEKGFNSNKLMITNARHLNALKRATSQVEQAISHINDFTDCLDIELNEAYQILGEITGSTANEEIIDNVFKKFCLGK